MKSLKFLEVLAKKQTNIIVDDNQKIIEQLNHFFKKIC